MSDVFKYTGLVWLLASTASVWAKLTTTLVNRTQSVAVGTNVTFICQTDDNTSPIRWQFRRPGSRTIMRLYNGYTMNLDVANKTSVQNQPGRTDLTVHNVQFSDAGCYECLEQFKAVSLAFELSVREPVTLKNIATTTELTNLADESTSQVPLWGPTETFERRADGEQHPSTTLTSKYRDEYEPIVPMQVVVSDSFIMVFVVSISTTVIVFVTVTIVVVVIVTKHRRHYNNSSVPNGECLGSVRGVSRASVRTDGSQHNGSMQTLPRSRFPGSIGTEQSAESILTAEASDLMNGVLAAYEVADFSNAIVVPTVYEEIKDSREDILAELPCQDG